MLSAEAYYRVLGVNNGASETEIKTAYKRLAKYWHPDCNASAEAHDTFVAINEACRYLLQVKKEKNVRMHTSQEWQKQQQARAREKAMNDVRMRFEAYIRSDEYKELTAFSKVADFFSAVYILLLLIGLPLGILCIYFGPKALWTALLWVPIVFIVLENQMGIFSFLRLRPFLQSWKKVVTPGKLFGVVLLLINVYVLFSVGFNTLFPIGYLVAIYLIPVLIFLLFTAVISLFYHRLLSVFHTFLWSVSLVHCLLCVNYFTATQPQQITYRLLRKQTSTLIVFEQNQLKDYPHIRLFFNDELVFPSRYVNYTFARGGLGLPVVVTYSFSK